MKLYECEARGVALLELLSIDWIVKPMLSFSYTSFRVEGRDKTRVEILNT